MFAVAPHNNVRGMMTMTDKAIVLDTTSVGSSWTNESESSPDKDQDVDSHQEQDDGLEELGVACPSLVLATTGLPFSSDSYGCVHTTTTTTTGGDHNDNKSVQSDVTLWSIMTTLLSSQQAPQLLLFGNKLECTTTTSSTTNKHSSNNNKSVSLDNKKGTETNRRRLPKQHTNETAAAVIKSLGWKDTEIPETVRVVNHHRALQYTGALGKTTAQSVRAQHALPQPVGKITRVTTKTPIRPCCGDKTKNRGGFLSLWRKHKKSVVFDVQTKTRIDFKPIVRGHAAAFVLSNGRICTQPRYVTYFEVDVNEGPNEGLFVESQQQQPQRGGGEGEKEPVATKETKETTAEAKHQGQNENPHHPPCIAVGVSLAKFPWDRSMPGWDSKSYGYHGDDGSAFFNGKPLTSFGPTFGQGDVVGCGIDYRTRHIFFTLNGKFLGHAYRMTDTELLHGAWIPTVGLDSHAAVHYNDGTERPFCFDLLGFVQTGDAPSVL